MTSRTRSVRTTALVAVLAVLAGTAFVPASAASRADSARATAARIVASAPSGGALRVVTTVTAPDGRPVVRTVRVADRAQAQRVVAAQLDDPSAVTVSMAQPVAALRSNDPLRGRQWALDRLQAETLWRRADGRATRSTPRAVVAVVDTGVDRTHPDLRGNVMRGVDVLTGGTVSGDPHGHGTHVAGIVAAVAGNRRGVAGLAPRAAVLPIRVLGADGRGSSDDVARGVLIAVDRKAQVVNLSLSAGTDDPALARAVAYAQRKGVLVVAGAGNSGCGVLFRPVQYPAAYPGVVGVGSVDADLRGSSFSSCGSWVDVVAPGRGIWSTVPRDDRLSCRDVYCALSGTSMSSPYVAAAAALAMSRRGLSAQRVAARLEETARDLGPRGKDQRFGAGLLDARRLVG
ncbi:S8 family serine peptidase [uncultured Aeromicrobium sp.]|uniref:S8 family serine peptidase n=1 Tax=uncultured Aeromicrobium sp. TaxID=337820 RepID=UPI000B15ED4B|nr:S8 family serine peptidase [uncultured Aeromicrobium sp.]